MQGTGDPEEFLSGIVHEETQCHEDASVDLTVGAVYRIDDPGQIDFGGDELAAAETSAIEPRKRDEADDYGWWDLSSGQYLVEFNETLDAESATFVLQPRTELLERGGGHPTAFVHDLPRVPLSVSEGGLQLKENARVSTLRSPPK